MKKIYILFFATALLAFGCGQGSTKQQTEVQEEAVTETPAANDNMSNKGIGPVTSITIPETIDQDMVAKGKAIFDVKCTACHKPTEKYIGTAPQGVLTRYSPEWIMNMILNPTEMQKNDPLAKQNQINANGAAMTDMQLTEEEARSVLEYFRTL